VSIKDKRLIVFDGALGTSIDRMSLPGSVWRENAFGYNDYLNISDPDSVVRLHTSFLEAGADVIETNTFGANALVAAEYGLQDRVSQMNRLAVEHARRALADWPDRYVAGSVGPTNKLPILGHVGVREMREAYKAQMRALVEAGVDSLIIETCQDLLQLKTALVAAFEVFEELGIELPVHVSVTVERTGTMLLGSRLSAVVATLLPFPIFSLGLNCATGPDEMVPHIDYLNRNWSGRISCIPNAGIPEVIDGKAVFPMSPEDFAHRQKDFVERYGVTIVGGCCGTTYEHIRRLKEALANVSPCVRPTVEKPPSLACLYDSQEIAQEIPPLIIGERMNASGSKKFRKYLMAGDFDKAVDVGRDQGKKGAHLLDLNTAYAGRDEKADMGEMTVRLSTAAKSPLVIDSTKPEVIETALELYPGRALINSVNLEDGGKSLDKILKLVKKFGAKVVALAIGPDGMAMTADDKLKVAREIHNRAVRDHGLQPSDIFFDMLTFTIGSGDKNLKAAAEQTLEAVKRAKQELTGSFTILGVSNISYGLPKQSRSVLNSIFLDEAIKAGLDAAIVDAGNIMPVAKIPKEERKLCLDLIYDRGGNEEKSPLDRFIEHFERQKTGAEKKADEQLRQSAEETLEAKLISGEAQGLEDVLAILMERYEPLDVVNTILVPAMRRIGELFGRGEMLLPFVLKSAEIMKKSVDRLESLMERRDAQDRLKVLLATVQGDVHDIGKNLVDIILSNNGYEVINLGTNVPAEKIIEKAIEHSVDVVGLSGLLVRSAIAMKESMPLFKDLGLKVPILLGGAALNARFVAESCVPSYGAPVVYCRDAFAGLKAMKDMEQGSLRSTAAPRRAEPREINQEKSGPEIGRGNRVPRPPFLGARHVLDVDPSLLFDKINKQALFRGRWGYRRADKSEAEYAELVAQKVEPIFTAQKARILNERLAEPKVSYGYFKCFSKEDALFVEDKGRTHRLDFPRQGFGARLCIADYFKTADDGGDVVGFFVVTLGDRISKETRRLFESDQYHDYLMLHGFSVELTDALAAHWHAVMKEEIGVGGNRYAFGYTSCPDLNAHEILLELLDLRRIGVSLTETMQMVPEVSTSAIVVHHPEAIYFSV
jgi:5-methyltetrahydrofolate--homocysteine methyltransferase